MIYKFIEKPPFKKMPVMNTSDNLEWDFGSINSNIIVENKKLGVKLLRYKIISNVNDIFLYDTFSIKEPKYGSVVILEDQYEKVGLIYEWRPIPNKWFWACIRGFGINRDKNHFMAGKREVIEEIGECTIVEEIEIGKIYQNTTFFENPSGVILLKITNFKKKLQKSEGIKDLKFFSLEEIKKMIFDNLINCQFTLSALAKYIINKELT